MLKTNPKQPFQLRFVEHATEDQIEEIGRQLAEWSEGRQSFLLVPDGCTVEYIGASLPTPEQLRNLVALLAVVDWLAETIRGYYWRNRLSPAVEAIMQEIRQQRHKDS